MSKTRHIFFRVFRLNTNYFQTDLLDPLRELKQVQLVCFRVNLGVMTTNGFSKLRRAPELKPHYQMQLIVKLKILSAYSKPQQAFLSNTNNLYTTMAQETGVQFQVESYQRQEKKVLNISLFNSQHYEVRTKGKFGCPRGVMVKAMNCGIVVREFVLQSRYYVHFRANTLGKGMNPLILPPTMGK